jgi:hypothetical protein
MTRIPFITVALAAGLTACQARVTGARPTSGAQPATAVTPCDPRVPESMVGRLIVTFTGASSGEVVVRLESDAYRSTVRISAAEGSQFEVPAGNYRLRATLTGFRAVERAVVVPCNRDTRLEVPLSRR